MASWPSTRVGESGERDAASVGFFMMSAGHETWRVALRTVSTLREPAMVSLCTASLAASFCLCFKDSVSVVSLLTAPMNLSSGSCFEDVANNQRACNGESSYCKLSSCSCFEDGVNTQRA